LRFLILTQYFPPEVGAPQVRLLAMAKELQRRGHQVDVVTALPNYPRGQVFEGYRGKWSLREEVEGLPVIRTWIHAATGTNVARRLLSYFSFTLSAVWGCLRTAKPDLIFVESPPLFLGVTAWIASRLRRAPYVFNVSDLWPESAVQLGIVTNRSFIGMAEALERFCYRHARRVCAVTEGIRDVIAKVPGTAPVLLLPNGVDVETFRHMDDAEPEGFDPGMATFMFAGTHGYAQGLDVIAGAARSLVTRRDIDFVFIGDGPDKERLRGLAKDLPNVRFLDPVPVSSMPPYFSASRASIVPLRKLDLFKSARPSKILPSLACETPVIYSGEGETAELITERECGISVPPECPEKLAEAVTRLADDAALARTLGKHGRELVSAEYSWEAIIGRWLAEMEIS
jgi:putative colanic acid biosynthesis glycosyltransferase WcaI